MPGPDDVATWWADNPMTYGDVHGEASWEGQQADVGTREFFKRVDAQFLDWNVPLHGERPFDGIFPYEEYKGARVLEVGCGMGTMASLWAMAGANVTAVDLNPVAVDQTTERFRLLGLDGDVRQADARELPFETAAFDYVWSWGVLHHSPDIARSFDELLRVARPGAGFGVMVYNRHSILHWYMTEWVEGYLHAERWFLDDVQLASRYGDGARGEGNPYTWPVTKGELLQMLGPRSIEMSVRILGTDLDGSFQWLVPGIGHQLPRWMKKPWARRFGWSLWATGIRA